MCGISGFWSHAGDSAALAAIAQRMGDAIRHRGPDAHGEYVEAAHGLALAHRRLSILDLSPAGAQPMRSHSGRWVLAYNGEIYNHHALREQLVAEGQVAWRGHSDTEVILQALETWGVARTLAAMEGMFALAAWDRETHRLVLARDRLGEKPLYWGRMPDNTLLFGSELRALFAHPAWHGELDRDAIAGYLRYQYIPAPQSIFKRVAKLLPGHWLEIDAEGACTETAYWTLAQEMAAGEAARRDPARDTEGAITGLEAVLGQVVSEQMVADVPLGAFLSGGIDSSLIVAIMQARAQRPVKTFTVGFEQGEFDESTHARDIARHLGTEHHEVRLSGRDALALVPDMADHYDEPFADSSQLPTALVARFARKQVTVALSGDGGDELFGGYARYAIAERAWQRAERMPQALRRASACALAGLPGAVWQLAGGVLGGSVQAPADKAQRLARMLRAADFGSFYDEMNANWPAAPTIALGGQWPGLARVSAIAAHGQSALEYMQAHDSLAYLPDDILVKVDRAAMAVSLETRAPFLDRRVLAFAWQQPQAMKVRDGQGKWLMRELLARHVPRAMFERPKRGFAVPLQAWLRGPLREWAEALLSPERLAQDGLLDGPRVLAAWRAFLAGRDGGHYRLWSVLMLQAWLARYRGFIG